MIVQSRKVWVLNTWLQAQVEFSEETGKMTAVRPYGERPADEDFGDLRILPGFIDVHTHGAGGFDTNDADEEGLRNWAESLVKEGVTGFLPTTITQSEEVLTAALRNVAEVVNGEKGYKGARILGIHFEGPYLDSKFKGAQPEQFCVKPDIPQFERYWEASRGLIRIATVACEHDEEFALTRWMTEHGIAVSLGHSSASYEQAALAFANGARSVTHVFNGMAPFHHRSPGIVGAAMRFRNVYGEVICDGNHSAWPALNDYFAAKGPDYGVMITDSLRVKGLPAGTQVRFGGNLIELCPDGCARLVIEDAGTATMAPGGRENAGAEPKMPGSGENAGTKAKEPVGGENAGTKAKEPGSGENAGKARLGNIAGSTLKVNEGLRNLVEKAEVPWQTAINACTINPARLLGMDHVRGSIQTGKEADLAVLRDDYSVESVYVSGMKQF